MTANRNPAEIVIDHYLGGYGPTLRIDVQGIERLVQLKELLSSLAEQRQKEIKIHELSWARLLPKVKGLTLRVVQPRGSEYAGPTIESKGSHTLEVLWTGPETYWKRSAGLVDGLLNHAPRPGHQYLSDESVDGTLIELAFME